jgi:chromosome segregation ATPase
VGRLQLQRDNDTTKVERMEEDIEQLRAELRLFKEDNQQLQAEVGRLQLQRDDGITRVERVEEKAEQLRAELRLSKEDNQQLQAEMGRLQLQRDDGITRVERVEEKAEQLRAELRLSKEDNQQLQAEMGRLQLQRDNDIAQVERVEEKAEQLRAELRLSKEDNQQLQAEMGRLQLQRDNDIAQVERMEEREEQLRARMGRMQERIDILESDLDESLTEVAEAIAAIRDGNLENYKIGLRLGTARKERNAYEQRIAQLEGNVEVVNTWLDLYETRVLIMKYLAQLLAKAFNMPEREVETIKTFDQAMNYKNEKLPSFKDDNSKLPFPLGQVSHIKAVLGYEPNKKRHRYVHGRPKNLEACFNVIVDEMQDENVCNEAMTTLRSPNALVEIKKIHDNRQTDYMAPLGEVTNELDGVADDLA